MDQTSRFNKEVINNESMRYIANEVSKRIKRLLTNTEIAELFAFTRLHATQNWNGIDAPDIRKKLILNFINSKFTTEGRTKIKAAADIVDVHEIMKGHLGTTDQEPDYESVNNVDVDGNPIDLKTLYIDDTTIATTPIAAVAATTLGSLDNIGTINKVMSVATLGNISAFMGKTDDTALQQLVNPQAAWRKNYIILDSRYRDTSQDVAGKGITNFIWNFLVNSSVNTPGAVNSLGNVQQLVSIQSPNIRIPYIPNTLVNAYKRVSLLINEFSGQSCIAQEGRKYHFLYSAELDNNMLECRALPNDTATFEFAKPITQLDTFTVSFGCPLEPIVFDADRAIMAISYTNPARLTGTLSHNLQTGDQVYLTDFTTRDVSTDNAIISAANSPAGFNIFVIDQFTIELSSLDFTTVTAPINPYNIPAFFGSKRLFIPIELKYVSVTQKSQSH